MTEIRAANPAITLALVKASESHELLGVVRGAPMPSRPITGGLQRYTIAGETVAIHDGALEAIVNSARAMPYNRHLEGPEPLPLFVAPRIGMRDLPWESEIDRLLRSVTQVENLEVARLARVAGPSSRPAEMPIRALVVGEHNQRFVHALVDHYWTKIAEIATDGITATCVKSAALETALWTVRPAVVIVDESELGRVLRWGWAKQRSQSRGLRVVVAISNTGDPSPLDHSPEGTAIVHVTRSNVSQVLAEIVHGFAHDLPLHASVHMARQKLGLFAADTSQLLLSGNADCFNGLRLAPIAKTVVSRIQALGTSGAPVLENGSVTGLLRLASKDPFAHEIDGFLHLSRMTGAIAQHRRSQLHTAPRTVDMRIEDAGDTNAYVPPTRKLQHDKRYQLCITIGSPLDGSLLSEPPPGIDPLLRKPRRGRMHELEIAVFGFGIEVEGARLQHLSLPNRGPSQPVRFQIRVTEFGEVRARVILYARNQALQAFMVTAVVGENDGSADLPVLHARLEFSRSSEFRNVHHFQRRLLSIAVNANGTKHSLMVKRDGSASQATTSSAKDQQIETAKLTLLQKLSSIAAAQEAKVNQGLPDDPKDPQFRADFADLAQRGADFHAVLGANTTDPSVEDSPGLIDAEALVAILESGAQTIQVVRCEGGFVLPWRFVYDYDLPPRLSGAVAPDVCTGGATCDHKETRAGYCIYGFWGVRHVIEELWGTGLQDDLKELVTPAPGRGLQLAVGIRTTFSQALTTKLGGVRGATVLAPGSAALTKSISADDCRPAHLLIYSHLETQEIAQEPSGRRILFMDAAKREFLLPSNVAKVLKERKYKRWRAPRTVVFVLTCNSTDDRDLLSFGDAFHDLGASAVAGIDVPAYEAIASEFAHEVATRWWAGPVSLGEAIREFRASKLAAGNLVGFAFNMFGNADLGVR